MDVIALANIGMPSHRLSVDLIEKIVELTYKGASRQEIARQLGIGKRTVYNYQKSFDLL